MRAGELNENRSVGKRIARKQMATYRASAATTARRIGRSCRQSKLHSLKEEIKVERPFCFFFVFNYYLLIPPLLQDV